MKIIGRFQILWGGSWGDPSCPYPSPVFIHEDEIIFKSTVKAA